MSGELVLSLFVGLAVVFCGCLAHWGAVRSFTRKSDTDHDVKE